MEEKLRIAKVDEVRLLRVLGRQDQIYYIRLVSVWVPHDYQENTSAVLYKWVTTCKKAVRYNGNVNEKVNK